MYSKWQNSVKWSSLIAGLMMEKKTWKSGLSFSLFKKRKSNDGKVHLDSQSSITSDGRSSQNTSESSSETSLKADQISIKDFDIVRKLGHGGFGKVFLAKYRPMSDKLMAIKVIVKKEIPDNKTDREHVQAEHFCLTHFGYPFIVRLYCSFQTPSKLFYATEFLQGGELFSWMEKFGKFSKVSFYLTSVLFSNFMLWLVNWF